MMFYQQILSRSTNNFNIYGLSKKFFRSLKYSSPIKATDLLIDILSHINTISSHEISLLELLY